MFTTITNKFKNMQIRSKPITIDTYLKQFNYEPIRDDGENILIQLHNLKLLQIQYEGNNNYAIQEVTQGKAGERWEDISIGIVIEHIQMLEGGNDTFSKIWHVDDVLSIDSTLSRDHARLVLQMAIDNHNPAVGINTKVLTKYIRKVLKMKADDII
jgi:hypothetical protein